VTLGGPSEGNDPNLTQLIHLSIRLFIILKFFRSTLDFLFSMSKPFSALAPFLNVIDTERDKMDRKITQRKH